MAKPIFTLPDSVTPEAMQEAITATWEKAKKKAAEKGREFNEPAPTFTDGQSASDMLTSYATQGRLGSLPDQSDTPLTKAEAERVGAALLQYESMNAKADTRHAEFTVTEDDGKGGERTYNLEAKELSAYLQANADKPDMTVADWVTEKKIGLTSEKNNGLPGGNTNVKVGDYELNLETQDGQSRIVSNGIVTDPMKGGAYGDIQNVTVGDGDELDVYVSNSAQKGGDYKVFVFQQMDGGKPDELKVGFAKNVDEFRDMMSSTWANKEDFNRFIEGTTPQYVELTKDQFKQLTTSIQGDKEKGIEAKPNLTLDEFVNDAGLNKDDIKRTPSALAPKDTEQQTTQLGEPQERKLSQLSGNELQDILKQASAAAATKPQGIAMASDGHNQVNAPGIPGGGGQRSVV